MNYDVVVLGSGIAGSAMATVLAKHGISTVLIDRAEHPRFSLGESMIPATSYLLRIMADRYEVPEFDNISTFLKIRKKVTASAGIKRNFSFVYHDPDRPFDAAESTMLPVPHHPHGPEAHLYRQDIDAYLYRVAVKYGATVLQNTAITEVDENADGVSVTTADGRAITGKYLLDCTGAFSAVAQKFDLRERPARMRTNSSCVFTHMIGVKPFDELYSPEQHGLPQPLSQGTLHHIFDGGWLWIIPFDNHDAATNDVCSIGLHLDQRGAALFDQTQSPETVFAQFLERFPEIAPQFEQAHTVRPWIRIPRTQYSSKRILGDRYCLVGQAAGAVDALFSRGLYITMEAVNAIGWRLIEAVRDNDFDPARFAEVERLTQGLLDAHDSVVHGSYIAFRSFDLWNAWNRVWALGGTFSSLRFRQAHLKYKITGDRSHLDNLDTHPFVGTVCADSPEYQQLFTDAYGIMLRVEQGDMEPEKAVAELYALYEGKAWIPPIYDLANPERRYVSSGDYRSMVESTMWGYTEAPEEIRERYFDFPAEYLFGAVRDAEAAEARWHTLLTEAAAYPTFGAFDAK
ncbi:NAD(P)/FAD-dependent oxidoreductase [Nocardia tengchongensis]|uniref:NAD(P)/FAD-dependent oxidoreductase n=1 Tax=Nocardia tengchongensis TaxID=2055889 RepID=UPI0036B06D76